MTPPNTLPRSLLWPPEPGQRPPGWSQSLAKGAVGTALLHIERAHAGTGSWQTAHAWLAAATSSEITGGPTTGLFFGAPAVAYALHTANRCAPGRYERALAALGHSITNTTRLRLDQAHARIDRAEPARFAEWDLIYGLTGIGAYLLRRDPRSPLLRDVLSYLVRLTEPLHRDGEALPGWWTHTDPTGVVSPQFPGGHGNLGIAHGITGPLALLSLAPRHGVNVDGHSAAVARICTWLDTWRQDSDTGPWWPRWITLHEHRTGRLHRARPARPSWCYGTPGVARAQQLAGIAAGDRARQHLAESAIQRCLTDPAQLGQLTDLGVCHGWAGLYQTAWRIAADALTPELTVEVQRLGNRLTERGTDEPGAGLLEGAAGTALAQHGLKIGASVSGWDACLLIS